MSGYPQPPPGYGYGASQPPTSQPYASNPYASHPGAPQTSQPYASHHGGPQTSKPYAAQPYAAASAPSYGSPSAPSYGGSSAPSYGGSSAPSYGGSSATSYGSSSAPSYGGSSAPSYGGSATSYGGSSAPSYGGSSAPSYGGPSPAYTPASAPGGYPPAPGAYGSPFASLMPSSFPPGTDPNIVACFQVADRDGSGLVDDKELQGALSSYNQSFSLRTVRLLMYTFTNTNTRKIGPKEFIQVFHSLQNWRAMFEKVDRDRSGKIDANELREALISLGFAVSPVVLELLVSKFDKTGGKSRAIEYDNFIECCLTVKGLTEKFKEKDATYSGSATFTYENFMLAVLPFLIA